MRYAPKSQRPLMPSPNAHEKRKQNQWYREETPCAHDTLCYAMHSQPLKMNVYESSIDAAECAEKMLL